MKITSTCVTWSDISSVCATASVEIEHVLRSRLSGASFNEEVVDQIVVVIVAVDPDHEKNKRWARKHDRPGVYTDLRSGRLVRYVSFALPLNPDEIANINVEFIVGLCIHVLQCRLEKATEKERSLLPIDEMIKLISEEASSRSSGARGSSGVTH